MNKTIEFIKESNSPESCKEKSIQLVKFLERYNKFWLNTERNKNHICFYFNSEKENTKIAHSAIYGEDANFYLSYENIDCDNSEVYVGNPTEQDFIEMFSWLNGDND